MKQQRIEETLTLTSVPDWASKEEANVAIEELSCEQCRGYNVSVSPNMSLELGEG